MVKDRHAAPSTRLVRRSQRTDPDGAGRSVPIGVISILLRRVVADTVDVVRMNLILLLWPSAFGARFA
jgi:hypothetical protein